MDQETEHRGGTDGETPERSCADTVPDPRDAEVELRAARAVHKLTSWTRFIAGVPAFGLFVCSVVLAVVTLYDALLATVEAFQESVPLLELATEYIEYADIFLLAVVLYIMALGLFTLFVSDRILLPSWLEFHDFDDLKERLVSVICVMLGVYFLGVVLQGGRGLDLVWLGIGIATVVLAMTVFVHLVIKGRH